MLDKEIKYGEYLVNITKKYQKKYNFEMENGSSHNNQADAFKHAFMSAEWICQKAFGGSSFRGNFHEVVGKQHHQPIEEYYMDLWNNQVGRDIGIKILNELGNKDYNKIPVCERVRYQDKIAEKIKEKMNKGKLITGVSDKRIEQLKKEFSNEKSWFPERKISDFIKKKYPNSSPTGYAADIDDDMVKSENRVFHNKEVNLAQTKDKELTNQVLKQYFENGNKMPSEAELKEQVASGDLIYVNNYTRSDGTKVSGYYRTH